MLKWKASAACLRLLFLGCFLLDQISALPLSQKEQARADGDEEGDEGWTTMEYVYLGVGILVGVIVLACLISYFLCQCMAEILCLPFKCLKGILCCCCD